MPAAIPFWPSHAVAAVLLALLSVGGVVVLRCAAGEADGGAAGDVGFDAEAEFERGVEAFAEAVALEEELAAAPPQDPDGEEAAEGGGEAGAGPRPGFAKAFAHFEAAGEAGHAEAALRASEMLLEGRGIPKSTIGAFEWALKAAEAGSAEAQFLVATKFEEGRGTTRSLSRALAWYERAMDAGFGGARMKVATLLDRGDPGVERDRGRALPLFQQEASAGDAGAMFMIGSYLQRGHVVAKDEDAASRWYQAAAELGDGRAQRKLAIRYLRGTGVREDPVEALKWCELTLRNPTADAESKNLAREYMDPIKERLTERRVAQAMRAADRFEVREPGEVSLPPLPYSGPPREYFQLTDHAGNELEAAILAVSAESVAIERRSDGARFEVPLRRLSEASRELVRGWAAGESGR